MMTNMEWISINDRLPNSGEYVLVVRSYQGEFGWTDPMVDVTRMWNKTTGNVEWEEGGKVTHWMPLPEIPEK